MTSTTTTAKNSEDYLNNLKTQLNKGINLLDYFLVIGPKPEIFMNDWLYDNDIDDLIADYLPQLSPDLLTQFPPIEKTITGLDETIIQHCFPTGYTIESHSKAPPFEIFSIILDNNLFSIDYPYKYVTCLKIYEGISSYRKLYDRYNMLIDKQKSNMMSKSEMPFPTLAREVCSTNDTTITTTTTNTNTTTIAISNSKTCRIAGTPRTTFGSIKRVKYRSLYLAKCICLVSLYPFFTEYSKILKSLYQYSLNIKVKIPLEKFIQHLVIEVPVPPRGLLSVDYPLFNEVITLKQSCINELPSLHIEFEKLFVVFQLDQIMTIFKHVLLESRIVFFSSNICLLTPIMFSSLCLIYPFEYPFNIASILPKEAYHLIENVTSVIVGVNEEYKPSFFNDNDIDISDITILIVDIDKHHIELKKQRVKKEDDIPDLPKQYREKLEKKINAYVIQIKTKKEPREMFSYTIRNYFLKFFIRLLKNYNKYLNSDIYNHNNNNKKSLIHNAFKVKEFMQTIDNCDRQFYNKLILETQLFVDFIYKRMTPKSQKEKLQILFFEEKMFDKYSYNRKSSSGKALNTQSVFISSNDYAIRNSYTVDKVKELTLLEKKHFNNKDIIINCLFNGLIVDTTPALTGIEAKDQSQPQQPMAMQMQQSDYSFTSPIFPRLMSDFYFKTSIEQKSYFIPQNLSDNLDPINTDLIGKSHLNTVEIKDCEMDNYIYLCWIKLWALSFWYHDKQERNCRFKQLLDVLDKVIHHETEIFNLLFQVLIQNKSDEDMIITLYQRLIFYRLNPSSYVFDVVSKLIEKREKRGIITPGSMIKYINNFKYESKEIENAFRRRTFKNKNDTRIIKEQIKIYGRQECFSCKSMITLHSIIENINRAKKQNLWAECPQCHNDFIPTLTIRFGAEFNPKGDLKINTSLYDDLAFYSPFTLYYNLIPTLTHESKLDIETFKGNFLPIFWNCVFYFKTKGINHDFFLPYEDSATKKYNAMSMNKNIGFDISYQLIANAEAFNDNETTSFLLANKERSIGKFNSNRLILRKEIELDYPSMLIKSTNGYGNDNESGEYTPVTTNENMIVCTEESMINANGIVDNSSIYCDTLSRYTDTEMSDDYNYSKYKFKISGLYQLNEIKEDQNENIMSQMNTPNKPLTGNAFRKETIDNPSSSIKQLSVKDLDCVSEMKSGHKESFDVHGSSKALSFGQNCSIMSNEGEGNKTPYKNDREVIMFNNDMICPVTLKSSNAFDLGNDKEKEKDKSNEGIERNTTPTKNDFSIDPEVIKEFREKYSSKTERSDRDCGGTGSCIGIGNENNKENMILKTNKIMNNILCHSLDSHPHPHNSKPNYLE